MEELLLIAGQGNIPRDCVAAVIVHFDAWDVPAGHISLPLRLQNELTRIRSEHAAWAYDLGRKCVDGREVQEWLCCGDKLSLWWCSLLYERHPKMTPGLYEIYRLRVLECLLNEQNIRLVRLCGGNKALAQSIAALCAASNRFFRQEDTPDTRDGLKSSNLLAGLYRFCPAPLRAVVRFVYWLATVKRKLPYAPSLSPVQNSESVIVTYFPNIDIQAAENGRFRSRYFENLHDLLEERGISSSLRWLFIRFPAPGFSLARCIALRDDFRRTGRDGASFHYLEEFISPGDMAAALLRFVRLVFASLRLERQVRKAFCFRDSRFNFWDRLSPYWAESFRGWRCLERCLQQRAFRRWAKLVGPARWTLFPLENCPWERMLTHAVHAVGGGPVFGVQHSVIRSADFRYFDDPRSFSSLDCALFQPDAVRGNGQSAYAQWMEAGVPSERLGKVEALRYLYLVKDQKTISRDCPSDSFKSDFPGSGFCERVILVVTSFFADETKAHLSLLAEAVRNSLLNGYKVVVKPHPYLPVRQYLQDFLGQRAGEVAEVGGAIADHLLPGVTVWASNSTTAALDAAIMGLSVIVMPPVADFDLCPLQDVPGLMRTANLEDVRRALREAKPLHLPADYLELNTELPLWRKLLEAD